jgi:hypothetical protein
MYIYAVKFQYLPLSPLEVLVKVWAVGAGWDLRNHLSHRDARAAGGMTHALRPNTHHS